MLLCAEHLLDSLDGYNLASLLVLRFDHLAEATSSGELDDVVVHLNLSPCFRQLELLSDVVISVFLHLIYNNFYVFFNQELLRQYTLITTY